jgi:ADP-ribose pyrophosphatase YjhB (NUDIX family)
LKGRVVVSAVICKGDSFLFGRKTEGVGPYPNKWLILGGGLNAESETIEEGLRREIREEGGIEITNIRHFDFGEDYAIKKGEKYHFIFLNFIVDYLSGEPKPGDDIEELKWVHNSKLEQLDLCEPSIGLFTRLGYL